MKKYAYDLFFKVLDRTVPLATDVSYHNTLEEAEKRAELSVNFYIDRSFVGCTRDQFSVVVKNVYTVD
jgi:hypothetical protein